MRKSFRIFLYLCGTLVLVAALLLASLFFVQPKRYQAFIEQHLIRAALDRGIVLRIGGSELTPSRFTAYNLQLFFPRAFFGLDVERVRVFPSLPSLLTASPRVHGEIDLYRGRILTETGLSWRSGLHSAVMQADEIRVADHPFFAGFGVREGTLKGRLEDARFDARGLESGDLQLQLEGVAKPEATSFPLQQFGLPLRLDIPAFENLGIAIQARFIRPELDVRHFVSESSLATVRGTARLEIEASGKVRRWQVDGTTELTPAGQAFFGQYLVLLSGGTLEQSTQRFRFATRGPENLSTRFSRY